ncbi:unnamed protein product [Brassica napus]|uniref:(rape) hypothetical protein n=1 Tax=Brassica napus TaxID=3708 RepID=A0A816ZQ24_BRANA|nr:unnamed protein product [Brassica napus]
MERQRSLLGFVERQKNFPGSNRESTSCGSSSNPETLSKAIKIEHTVLTLSGSGTLEW